jgi:hypothetical protein
VLTVRQPTHSVTLPALTRAPYVVIKLLSGTLLHPTALYCFLYSLLPPLAAPSLLCFIYYFHTIINHIYKLSSLSLSLSRSVSLSSMCALWTTLTDRWHSSRRNSDSGLHRPHRIHAIHAPRTGHNPSDPLRYFRLLSRIPYA